MIATLYILEYHKKHALGHVVGVHNPPTGQQYLVVHTTGSNTGSTIHVPNTIVPSTIPGYGHSNGIDSPSPDNSLSVATIEKSSVGNRGKFFQVRSKKVLTKVPFSDKNQSPTVIKPVTVVPQIVTPRTRTPGMSTFSTTRFSPSSSLVPTDGVNPFNDLSEGGKSSSDRDRQKDRNYGHNDRSPVVVSDTGHTDTSTGSGHGTSEDEDQHAVLPSGNGLNSKSVSNPVSNGVSNNGHSSDPEINI